MAKTIYKITCDYLIFDYYADSEKEAREIFESLKGEYGDGIRLYDSEYTGPDEDPNEWDILDYFDKEDEEDEQSPLR